ncbi:hypothetical protein L228DRAFT_171408 [Xylona heveae TC161]|uniref:Sld7 C-terminal domain-containing protein n=1 Tax=Xylona heveae (strain CBS 132557 / TC161) TaxID=1328760 RepID=A0A165FU75_XYLHT|nr:hypothetical protein L228DRAFT_171408 [Xylona heveae TC161]KZF21386.1 hypothetical protein L228DRAFT_171408 [Xylona heveae TC161]
MELWKGCISATNPSIMLEDVRLFSSHPKPESLGLSDKNFEFLAFVDPSRIPIHLIAGIALDVKTESQSTLEWFTSVFVDADGDSVDNINPWWESPTGQSDVGVLIRVEDAIQKVLPKIGPRITELLIYGTTTRPAEVDATTLTSQTSSSTYQPASNQLESVLNVKALPLSSDLLYPQSEIPALLKAPGDNQPPTPASPAFSVQQGQLATDEAQFLPPLFDDLDGTLPLVSAKRKRVDSLFEDAAERRKRSKAKGGESISQTMAKVEGSTPQPPSLPRAPSVGLKDSRESTPLSKADSTDSLPKAILGRQSLSRSFSAAAAYGDSSNYDEIRPFSRRKSLVDNKRSSLARTSFSAEDLSQQESFESKNKAALSRIVMAAMRIYGFQQRRKPEKREDSEPPFTNTHDVGTKSSYAEEQEEYKLVYHQTFKGASFALRKRMAASLLPQETMRDVVDRLLAIFCTE